MSPMWCTRPKRPLPSERVPIGAAMADAELLNPTENLAPVPDGQSGELYVGGPVLCVAICVGPSSRLVALCPIRCVPASCCFVPAIESAEAATVCCSTWVAKTIRSS